MYAMRRRRPASLAFVSKGIPRQRRLEVAARITCGKLAQLLYSFGKILLEAKSADAALRYDKI
jgi:hypothetical protein